MTENESRNPRQQKRLFVNRQGKAERVERNALCKNSEACGSCQFLSENYNQQLANKTDDLKRHIHLMPEIFGSTQVRECVPSPQTLGYRHTAKLVVNSEPAREPGKKPWIHIGLYKPGTHHVVAINGCPVQDDKINAILGALPGVLSRNQISIYDESKKTGVLRYIVFKTSHATRQTLLTFVTTSPQRVELRNAARDLTERFSDIVGVLQHVNASEGNAIFQMEDKDTENGETSLLVGKDSLTETLCGLTLRFSATSFMQINPYVAEKVYYRMMDLGALKPTDTVLDLYCGTGAIALLAAKHASRVIGIEETASSVEDAQFNAQANGSPGAQFFAGRAEDVLPRLRSEGTLGHVDVISLNPSRRGCQPEVLEEMARIAPRCILYMSCNPTTLLRDLKKLKQLGYKTLSVEPFDMFPRTRHYEVLAHLVRQEESKS